MTHQLIRAIVLAGLLITSAQAFAGEKRIAITYDDAPRGDGGLYSGDERTAQLIRVLDSVNSGPVAFFVTSRGIDANNGAARLAAYAAAGHILANHSHSHLWAHRTSAEEYLADISLAQGYLAAYQNTRPWFRFPYLDEGRRPDHIKDLAKGLQDRGLINGYVTVDTYDWHIERRFQEALRDGKAIDYDALGRLYIKMCLDAAEYYEALAQETLGGSPVHVLLLHENDLAARFSGDLIVALREAGWEIVSPDVAFQNPLPEPLTRLTSQGRVAALAIDAGQPARSIVHWGIEEESIDAALEESSAFQDR